MLEREEGLSEEEKKEAELWFAREQYKEVYIKGSPSRILTNIRRPCSHAPFSVLRSHLSRRAYAPRRCNW